MPLNAPLMPSGVTTLNSIKSRRLTLEQCAAAARAILRHGIYTAGHLNANQPNGLHPGYMDLHGGQDNTTTTELKAIAKFIEESHNDLFDAATALNRLDGGISLVLHCLGFDVGHEMQADDITLDVLFSPRELMEGRTELSKFLALLIQGFGREVALPYLRRFILCCNEEEIAPPGAPDIALKEGGFLAAPPKTVRAPINGNLLKRSIDPTFLSPMQSVFSPLILRPSAMTIWLLSALPTVKATVDDGHKGTIISLGPRTDSVINRYQLSNKEIIPAIRILSRSTRNSSWEKQLQGSKFNLSYEQARNLSRAMHGDLGVPNDEVCYYNVISAL
ncbi:hypothetical protein DXG01_014940 [Tephrocybe rancida]|nr:hypothetical protein DXG01_014940 [Tephrocybe rancida]